MSAPRNESTDVVRVEELEGGAVWRVLFNTPKANVLDRPKLERLAEIVARARNATDLKAIVLEGDGPNFSFGASVQEHLPGQVEEMLRGFDAE